MKSISGGVVFLHPEPPLAGLRTVVRDAWESLDEDSRRDLPGNPDQLSVRVASGTQALVVDPWWVTHDPELESWTEIPGISEIASELSKRTREPVYVYGSWSLTATTRESVEVYVEGCEAFSESLDAGDEGVASGEWPLDLLAASTGVARQEWLDDLVDSSQVLTIPMDHSDLTPLLDRLAELRRDSGGDARPTPEGLAPFEARRAEEAADPAQSTPGEGGQRLGLAVAGAVLLTLLLVGPVAWFVGNSIAGPIAGGLAIPLAGFLTFKLVRRGQAPQPMA